MRVLGGVLVLIPSHWCCCKNGGVGHTESPQGVCIEGIHMRAEQAGSHPQVGKDEAEMLHDLRDCRKSLR